MASDKTVNITLGEFVDSVLTQIRNNAGQTNTLGAGPSQNIRNFMLAWAHVEGGSQTNACSFNILNTMQDEEGASQCSGTIPGIKAYPDAETGEKAQVDALQNGNYKSLLHALVTNDETNLGFTRRNGPSFGHVMAGNIAGDLSVWVSGKRAPLAQHYILSIMQSAGISSAEIEGGTTTGGSAVSQDQIDKWASTVIGTGTTGDSGPSISGAEIVKIGGGSLMVLAGVALGIKAVGK